MTDKVKVDADITEDEMDELSQLIKDMPTPSITEQLRIDHEFAVMAKKQEIRVKRQEFMRLNGVVLIPDIRIKPGTTQAISFDTWAHHPVDTETMKEQVEAKNFFIRQLNSSQRKKIMRTVNEKLGKVVAEKQRQHDEMMRIFKKSNPEVARAMNSVKDMTAMVAKNVSKDTIEGFIQRNPETE
jgi:hypothetical protein